MAIIASTIFLVIGLLLILGFLYILFRNGRIKRNGILTNAKVVSISFEKGSENEEGFSGIIKVPVYSFEYFKNEKIKSCRIKGRSNSKVKIGDITPVYYHPKNPSKDYFLPKKDFFVKYMYLLIGFIFFSIGISKGFNFYSNYFNVLGIPDVTKENFLKVILLVFIGFVLWSLLINIVNAFIYNKKNKGIKINSQKFYKKAV